MISSLGCSASRQHSFVEAVDGYHHALRWGQLTEAASYIARKGRVAFLARADVMTGFRIVNIEVRRVDMTADDLAAAIVTVDWYRLDGGTLHTTVMQQVWERREAQHWRIKSQRKLSGDAFLLLDPGDRTSGSPSK